MTYLSGQNNHHMFHPEACGPIFNDATSHTVST